MPYQRLLIKEQSSMIRAKTKSKICKIEDCAKPVRARGWCATHWQRWQRHGDPLKTVKNYEKHGMFRVDGYKSWKSIKQRVLNKNCPHYDLYGGRGITVCAGIKNSFSQFITIIGSRPSKDYSVDRIDNYGGYWCGECDDCQRQELPMNIRWADRSTQQHNSRRYEVMA